MRQIKSSQEYFKGKIMKKTRLTKTNLEMADGSTENIEVKMTVIIK